MILRQKFLKGITKVFVQRYRSAHILLYNDYYRTIQSAPVEVGLYWKTQCGLGQFTSNVTLWGSFGALKCPLSEANPQGVGGFLLKEGGFASACLFPLTWNQFDYLFIRKKDYCTNYQKQ